MKQNYKNCKSDGKFEMAINSTDSDAILGKLSNPTNPTRSDLLAAILESHNSITKNLNNETRLIRKDVNGLQAEMALNNQRRLENDVILRGFYSDFDARVAFEKFCEIFGIESCFINKYYKFDRIVKIEEKSTKIYMLIISFTSLITKARIFEQIKKDGQLILEQLIEDCSDAEKNNFIYIDHCLTTENLAIKKRLYSLKKDKKITQIKYRRFFFHIQTSQGGQFNIIRGDDDIDRVLSTAPRATKRKSNFQSTQPQKISKGRPSNPEEFSEDEDQDIYDTHTQN